MRTALLAAAGNRTLQRFVTKHGRRFGSDRFVAGETLDDFMCAVRSLNDRGFRVAAGLLGEDVRGEADARAVTQEYRSVFDRFALTGANANVALKLTHLGLVIDRDLAYENIASLAGHAAEHGNFVRIDMEQSSHTDATIEIYRRLRSSGRANVGTVLQAYLYRSDSDLTALLPLSPNLRLVKGAYLEPADIAYPKKRDVDENFVRLIEKSLREGGFTAIATHDEAIIDHSLEFIRRNATPEGTYEFQMLYGVRSRLQASMIARGIPMRIAVPFGSQWYPYLMRRLAERPANLFFFVSSVWRG
jgi:proline dehydrogenase